ncbi:MAG: hypothetical protein J5582_13570 [Ruminococcus sp.]|nr:hypothetical protein [Ruminococcus sp.]
MSVDKTNVHALSVCVNKLPRPSSDSDSVSDDSTRKGRQDTAVRVYKSAALCSV